MAEADSILPQFAVERGFICAAYGLSDISLHLPVVRHYAHRSEHVTEFGTGLGNSTWALLAGRPTQVVSYDIEDKPVLAALEAAAKASGVPFRFVRADTLTMDVIEPTDLLLIDTTHTYVQLKGELEWHGDAVRRWILLHDMAEFGERGEGNTVPGMWQAMTEFLRARPDWTQASFDPFDNGLVLLERRR